MTTNLKCWISGQLGEKGEKGLPGPPGQRVSI